MSDHTKNILLVFLAGALVAFVGLVLFQSYEQRALLRELQARNTRTAPAVSTSTVPSAALTIDTPTTTAWVTTKAIDLPEFVVTQDCHGGDCSVATRLYVQRKKTGERIELSWNASTPPSPISLVDAEQVGSTTSTNSALLLSATGITPCDNEMMGCGPSLVVPLAQLGQPNSVRVLPNSDFTPRYLQKWSPDFRYLVGTIGICEGGCVPEPLYAWSVLSGTSTQATNETAYLNVEHFEGRTPNSPEVFRHWQAIRWLDTTHFEADILTGTSTVRTVKGEIR